MSKDRWVCTKCGSINPNDAIRCECGFGGELKSDAVAPVYRGAGSWSDDLVEAERPSHPEWEKLDDETSQEYGRRMARVMLKLSEEVSSHIMVTPTPESAPRLLVAYEGDPLRGNGAKVVEIQTHPGFIDGPKGKINRAEFERKIRGD